ncbi:GNAT family N-acetyltransferase [Paracoccus sp. TK19116]|uniref:GNAT family N-acetyltransferase n=1 Tax=Paracoccus albicereus TaxID=2922394 RepID=A0ABT1MRI7_9RHOB|nr:GNAT family N-acetyltransferase [Paracoccus albicereus]MCQ0970915.1 GNAT family N-acetyltransferase [Paracoccus albicereus]
MDSLTISVESPLADDLELLFQRHTADMHADTPPESIHMLPRTALVTPDITFLVGRLSGEPVAMGALKRLAPDHGELKSMHVLAEWRGRGLSRVMLNNLMGLAREQAISKVSLETGAQPGFVAARALYARAGFSECPAFPPYRPDPNSVFMTRML